MKVIKIILLLLPGIVIGVVIMLYIAGTPNESESKIIAGNMSHSTICSTAGYIIKKRLGNNFRVHSVPCKTRNIGKNKVEINSGYISPLGPTLRYTARGQVYDNTLVISEIKVDGMDNDFIPYNKFQR